MIIIQQKFPLRSTVFWVSMFVIVVLTMGYNQLSGYLYPLLFGLLGALIFGNLKNRIVLHTDHIVVLHYFDKCTFYKKEVKNIQVQKRNAFIQLLFGLPKNKIHVEYNQYNRISLNTDDERVMEFLQEGLATNEQEAKEK